MRTRDLLRVRRAGAPLIVAACLFPALGAVRAATVDLAVVAGKIVPVEGPVVDGGAVLIGGGKILAVAPRASVEIPPGTAVIDAGDRWIMPGIVEAHTHIATEGGFNDMVFPLNPDLAMGDCVDFESPQMALALAEGITTINTMPGSGTNHAGFSVIVKTAGGTRAERIVRDPGCMKIAQAFNPERRALMTGDMGMTRMGMSYRLRRLLREGKAYAEEWREYEEGRRAEKPEIRRDLERVRLVFEGKIPVINHTYSGWGVAEAIRLFRDEYGLDLIATHTAFGGFQVGEFAARHTRVYVNIGPRTVEYRYPEDGRIHNMASEYWKSGVRNLSMNTDAVGFYSSRLSPQQHLFLQASVAARYGLEEGAAVRAITLEPARALGVAERVGSLKAGKDADLLIKRGALLDVTSPVDLVIVDGRIEYEREGSGIVLPRLDRGGAAPPEGKGTEGSAVQPGSRTACGDPGLPAGLSLRRRERL